MPTKDGSKKVSHFVGKVTEGVAAQKGVFDLRKGQKPTKPPELSRPKSAFVPQPPSQGQSKAPDKK